MPKESNSIQAQNTLLLVPSIYLLCSLFELLIIQQKQELLSTVILCTREPHQYSGFPEGCILNSYFHFLQLV